VKKLLRSRKEPANNPIASLILERFAAELESLVHARPRVASILKPLQPLPGILDFGQAGVGIFPERGYAFILRQNIGASLELLATQLDISKYHVLSSMRIG
jgi:hypothetical protein